MEPTVLPQYDRAKTAIVIGNQNAGTFHNPSSSNQLSMEINVLKMKPRENAEAAIDLGQLEQISLRPGNEITKAVIAHPRPTAISCGQTSLSEALWLASQKNMKHPRPTTM
ncbi:hypothetical protein FEM03_14640 [Phragmitibacter flavus]|uniref:Uncharacterized protein n=1 Tax=Phragmitibacter flavus TaxID=2576071 RepID=A0A5R8KCD7_9BACT|nr:hypothetical protein [Phragmitibacter flavus]TLD69966.1 hypothetical protein FEM03_14640 [Phragmitibacter flavus]